MLSAEGEPFLGLDGAPPERTIYLSLFQDSGLHRQGADGGAFAFSEPSKDDPRGWRPTWDAITIILGAGRPVSFQELMTELAKPTIGLRQGQSGRASWRTRVCQYLLHSVGAESLIKKYTKSINKYAGD